MTVFIAGSKNLKTLPEAAKEKLRGYMKDGIDILVGDCYGADRLMQEYLHENSYQNVTVFATEGCARNNVGNWSVCDVPDYTYQRPHTYAYYYEKDAYMSIKADFGYMLWNGNSKGTFINILNLIRKDKTVDVYMVDSQRTFTVNRFDDVINILPPKNPLHIKSHETLPYDIYSSIVNECVPSEEMRKYYLQEPKNRLKKGESIALILGSTLTLERKREIFKALSAMDDLLYDLLDAFIDDYNQTKYQYHLTGRTLYTLTVPCSYYTYYKEFNRAIKGLKLKCGEMLYFCQHWFDEDTYGEKTSGTAPLLSLHAAMDKLRHMIDIEKWDEDCCHWTSFEKWVPEKDGTMSNPYTYYLIRDNIVYFTRNAFFEEEMQWKTVFEGHIRNTNLNLPIPFSTGDIVTLDSLPFAPVKHAVLLRVDNDDCCGVQILYRGGDNFWYTAALKHGYSFFPMLSSLYKLSAFKGDLPEEEKILNIVSDYLGNDIGRATKLWKEICQEGYCTDEDILELINE